MHMVNHCSSDVFVRLLRHGSKITARNTGRRPAPGCPAEAGEECGLPASCWPLPAARCPLGQKPRVNPVSEVCDKDGLERRREDERDRQEGERVNQWTGKWEGLK